MSIGQYLLNNPHKKLLYNPLAAEFGINDMAQMNDFVRNQMPKFKMVRKRSTEKKNGARTRSCIHGPPMYGCTPIHNIILQYDAFYDSGSTFPLKRFLDDGVP